MMACRFTGAVFCAVSLLVFAFGGCHSSSPPATPGTTTETAPEPAASAESNADTPPAHGESEKWEGEAEATAAAPTAPKSAAGGETRTTELIQKTIADHRKPIRDCYDRARKELPTLRGTMTIHFVLDPEGKVKQAELNIERSDIKSPEVVDCAIAALKSIQFPASSRGMDTTVNYPFDFKP